MNVRALATFSKMIRLRQVVNVVTEKVKSSRHNEEQ